MTEDEMGGWHHQLNGHALEQTPGGSEGQGSLVCCSSWEIDGKTVARQTFVGKVMSLLFNMLSRLVIT